jgi:hypothetical protein
MMKKNKIFSLLGFSLATITLVILFIQCKPSEAKVNIDKPITHAEVKQAVVQSIGDAIINQARTHLGKPYVAHTLRWI